MKILVFGPTGGTGRALVEQALAGAHEVTAFARSPEKLEARHDRLSVVQGDALDPERVQAAMPGHEAVVSALGVTGGSPLNVCSEAAKNIVAAMRSAGVRRLVVESAYGAGPSRRRGPYARFLRVSLRGLMRDKDRMEEIVQGSGLDWVIVRPPILTNGPRTGRYRVGVDLMLGWFPRISRADVAEFMLDVADERRVRAADARRRVLTRDRRVWPVPRDL